MVQSAALLALASALSAVSALPHQARSAEIQCPIVLDGRVASSLKPADFDSYATSPFNPEYIIGEGLKFSEILKFPTTDNARFDTDDHMAVEVTISDKSIFMEQNGFRRAGLQIQGDDNDGSPGIGGVKTIHFSVKLDPQRPLNLSHEYLVRFSPS